MDTQTSVDKIIIPASYGKATRINKGQAVKLINTYGTQVVDCWAWNASNLEEYMSMEASRVWMQRLNPIVGDSFITNKRNPILTLVEDTSPGIHDTFMAACNSERYVRLGVKEYHRNCFDNMIEAVASFGLNVPHPNLASFNIFMNISVQADGQTLSTLPTVSQPNDHIIMKAEMDCIIAFSACPQDIVAIHGLGDNTPRDAAFVILDNGFPELPPSQPWVPSARIGGE